MALLKRDEALRAFGTFIKDARLNKGLYQREVAEKMGVTEACYSQIERGLRDPGLATTLNICKILGVSFNTFLKTLREKENSTSGT